MTKNAPEAPERIWPDTWQLDNLPFQKRGAKNCTEYIKASLLHDEKWLRENGLMKIPEHWCIKYGKMCIKGYCSVEPRHEDCHYLQRLPTKENSRE